MKETASPLLLATDRSRSVLTEITPGTVNRVSYSPYGSQRGLTQTRLGFNGELRDRPHGWYHLGNGHRIYNPVLRRFHSPDRLSPFAEGGLNPYAYCVGDPVNHTDPTGAAPQFLHIAALVGFGVAMLAGGVSIFGPVLLKSVAAASSVTASATFSAASGTATVATGQAAGGALSSYAALQPGVGATVLGGLEAFSPFLSMMGASVGTVGTIQNMQENSPAGSEELLFTGALVTIFGAAVKGLVVPLTPKLMTSTWGHRMSTFVHGKAKVAAAQKEALAAGGVARSVTPPPSPLPNRPIPKPRTKPRTIRFTRDELQRSGHP